ncbi:MULTISPECIES: hypothetical protein [Legionella]|uniref:Coiled-coil protein n=1 Tax=Legionella resiliens TaxID=2905958 RepID=A0ABS8WXL6_9GAMM|nr:MULTISPECIES: hypothetical protein [unclassified Legionella]MCE0722066.1 hypothetical protein [Legionella sp. 9fVS26]MCE3531220.1 hypothetical protein [Legionella sp. 8cVS16]QLZ70808.1 hypothetical protein FOLKNPGA_03627 [Legionella sp. PC1000]
MAYSELDKTFVEDKNQFFMQLRNKELNTPEDIDGRAGQVSYTFLLKNQKDLETEFLNLFAVLEKQKDEDDEKYKAFWEYCYYCATLLETFHKSYAHKNRFSEASFIKKYGRTSKEDEYTQLKEKIKKHLVKEKEKQKDEEEFINSLRDYFIKSFRNLFTSPAHLSQIRDYVAYANLCRVYWVFCRLTMVSGFALAKETQFLEKLDKILGTHTDADKIIERLKAPNGVLNYFSVGLFLIRFAIDAGYLVQHTFFPTDEEKKDKTTALERFKFELYKRHCNFANDLVWATVNFLTNFNHITHIPDPTAGVITAAFLGFDVCMTLYKCYLAKREYLAKKAQYDQEIEDYRNKALFTHLSQKEREMHIEMLEKQIIELEINWRTKEATFYFNAAAAALLMLGFSASLMLTGPGIPVVCFFVCTVAVAMYLSSDAYAKYQEKSLRLEHAKGKEDYTAALKEYDAAYNDFVFTMIKNTVIPTLLIATYAVCWPAAIALTVLFIGYEIYHAYDQHNSKKEADRLALESPKEEDILEDEKARLIHSGENVDVDEELLGCGCF